ncbi:MAG: hypothetical protein E6X19_30930, partial [Hungatella hathewayi]|nr:hypothetical protein [Hungatella hathewayi]
TVDTLAFGYILPTTGRIPDLHRLETCAAGRTKIERVDSRPLFISLLSCYRYDYSTVFQSMQGIFNFSP